MLECGGVNCYFLLSVNHVVAAGQWRWLLTPLNALNALYLNRLPFDSAAPPAFRGHLQILHRHPNLLGQRRYLCGLFVFGPNGLINRNDFKDRAHVYILLSVYSRCAAVGNCRTVGIIVSAAHNPATQR